MKPERSVSVPQSKSWKELNVLFVGLTETKH